MRQTLCCCVTVALPHLLCSSFTYTYHNNVCRVYERFEKPFECPPWSRYCGTQSNLTIDHVVPLASKGKWQWDNLVTACTRCNGRKGDKSLKQLNWRLKRQPWVPPSLAHAPLTPLTASLCVNEKFPQMQEPSPYELGMLFGTDAISVTHPPKEWSDYLFISKGDKFTSVRPVLDNVNLDAA